MQFTSRITAAVFGALACASAGAADMASDALRTAAQAAIDKTGLPDVVGRLDLSIPQSPAFTILGITPESVVETDDLRTIATSLLQGIDPNGNLQSGIGLDVRPYLALVGEKKTLADYRESQSMRILSTLRLSFATASGQSDGDKADRQALGLTLTPWREFDPANNYSELRYQPVPVKAGSLVPSRAVANGLTLNTSINDCYSDYLLAANETPEFFPQLRTSGAAMSPATANVAAADGAQESAAKILDRLAAGARKAVPECLERFKERYWNGGALELAIAGYRSEVEGFDEDGFGASFGYSHSLGMRGQVIVRAQYSDNRLMPPKDAAASYSVIDQTDFGSRLRIGSAKGTFMIEGQWVQAKGDSMDEEFWRAAVGGEFMVLPDIWIQLAVGKAFSTDMFEGDPVYSGQLRFGFSQMSLLGRR